MSLKQRDIAWAGLAKFAPVLAFGVTLLMWPLAAKAMDAPRYAEQGRSTPPSAFLHRKVYSIQRLIAQLKSEPGARKGYAKVFHISPDRVVPFIEHTCSETTLTKTGKYTVYRVTEEGTIYPTLQSVQSGSSVFAVKSAQQDIPRFISAMGDPMKPFAIAVTIRIVRQRPATKVVTEVSPSQETLVTTQPEQTVVPAPVAVYPAPATPSAAQSSQSSTTPGGELAK